MNIPPIHPITAGAACFILIILAITVGYVIGARVKALLQKEVAPIGAVVAAILGLLAFTLGFTFNIAASRFETRRQLVLDEANALGTLYLRSQLIAPELGSQAAPLIRQYVEIRANIASQPEQLAVALTKSTDLHTKLWEIAKQLAQSSPHSPIAALFVEVLNQVIDLHSSRVTVALGYRVPPSIWLMLALIAGIAMIGVGYQFGAVGSLNKVATVILAIAFSAVVMLIADLDHPYEGLLRISQKPMHDLLLSIASDGR